MSLMTKSFILPHLSSFCFQFLDKSIKMCEFDYLDYSIASEHKTSGYHCQEHRLGGISSVLVFRFTQQQVGVLSTRETGKGIDMDQIKPALKSKTESKIGLILLAFIAFTSLGLPDGLLGVAWPSIRESFSRPLDSLGVLLFAIMAGYLTSSFFSGHMIAWLGVGRLLAVSCAATGASLMGYTLVPTWWMIVACGAVAGLGAGAIDASLNTYVAANFGEGLMQWLHASWGIGVTTGPMIMTTGINVFNTWRWGYVLVGAAQLTLAACFVLTSPLWQRGDVHIESAISRRLTDYKTPILETLRHPPVWWSSLFFFLYAGIEATLGNWAYTLLTESRGILPHVAGLWTGGYWATFTMGRVLAGLCTKRIGVHTLIRAGLLAALGGAMLLWWNPTEVTGSFGVVIIGFSIAPIFPSLVSGTSGRVGPRYSVNTIGMQIGAAGLGTAILPGIAGILAQRTSLEMIPAYLGILVVTLFALYSLSMRQGKAQWT
jgi:fucose permease